MVQFDNGPPVEAPLALRVTGPERGTIKALSAQVAGIMRRTKGTRDVVDPLAVDRIDLDLGVDEAKASLLNVPPEELPPEYVLVEYTPKLTKIKELLKSDNQKAIDWAFLSESHEYSLIIR